MNIMLNFQHVGAGEVGTGSLKRLEAEFATQKDMTRGRQDIKTFKVKISVDNSDGILKPGMTVEVEIPQKDAQ